MAIPSINLNVRANTARAMADFKRFSDSLNNKFLVSGLKVDLISATLRQISSELQKSIGEQGLLGASSMRAAQNQAALLTSTFKGFGLEASKSINENMSKALSNVAVRAGGTMADIKKTMAAVPYISTNLSPEERTSMAKQIMGFQRDLRRAGISDQFGDLGTKFLSNNLTVEQMLNSGDSLATTIGKRLADKGAPMGQIYNAEQRTRLLQDVLNDPELTEFLKDQSKKTFGFRTYLEGLNTYLFNPESGVFGSLRKVKMSAYRTTTIFDETDKLIASIFGPEGIFLKFFKSIGRIFGVGDPLKIVITGLDFIRNQVGNLAKIIASPQFQQIVGYAKVVFDSTLNLFKKLYDQVTNYNWAGFLTKGENLFQRAPQQEGGKNQFEQIWESISKSAKKFDASRYINRPYKPEDLAQGNFEFGDLFNGQIFNRQTITEDIKKIGKAFREAVENFSKEIRGINVDKQSEFGSSVMGTLVEEIGRSIATIIRESFLILLNKLPQIAKFMIPELSKALNGIIDSLFGPLSPIVKFIANFLPGRLGMFGRGLNMASSLVGNAGTMGGMLATAGAAFFPQIRGGILGLGRGRAREAQRLQQFRLGGYLNRRLFWARDGRWRNPPRDGSEGGPGGLMDIFDRRGRRTRENARLMREIRRGSIPRNYDAMEAYRNVMAPGGVMRTDLDTSRFTYGPGLSFDANGNSYNNGNINVQPNNLAVLNSEVEEERERIQALIEEQRDALALGNARRDANNSRIGTRFVRRTRPRLRALRRTARVRVGRALQFARSPAGLASMAVSGIGLAMLLSKSANAANSEQYDPNQMTIKSLLESGMTEEEIAAGVNGQKFNMKDINTVQAKMKRQEKAKQQEEQKIGGMTNVLSGAANGAMVGMMFGPWGAAIGGLLGAGAALMDKGTREGVMGFIGDLGKGLSNLWKRVTNALGRMGERIRNGAISAGTFLADGLKKAFTGVINSLMEVITFIPRMQTNLVKSIINLFPENMRPGWLVNSVNLVDKALSFRFGAENNYRGKDYYGPAMAHEERMSGGRARIYNDREFVIPPDGFNTLAGLIENRVKGPSTPIFPGDRIELVINVNNPVMLGNNRELIESLRKPVLDIVNDAYRKNVSARNRPQYFV